MKRLASAITVVLLLIASPASAEVTVKLTQIGGTYSGQGGANAGDTITLQISVELSSSEDKVRALFVHGARAVFPQ